MTERNEQTHDQQNSHSDAHGGATLPGDLAGGAGSEWRGKLDALRETRRERKRWHRLRQPLIGLSMVGAAAPMAQAVKNIDAPEGSQERSTDPNVRTVSGDVEDAVGQRWAESHAEGARESAITTAMEAHDIDRELATAIYDISKEEGVDAEVAYGLVKTESTFRPRAVSPVGARGLTQVLPSTARWMMPEIRQASQLFQPETNLRVGFRYLRYLLDKYEGDTHLALLAYNRGPGTVDRILDRGGDPDNGYAGKVLRG